MWGRGQGNLMHANVHRGGGAGPAPAVCCEQAELTACACGALGVLVGLFHALLQPLPPLPPPCAATAAAAAAALQQGDRGEPPGGLRHLQRQRRQGGHLRLHLRHLQGAGAGGAGGAHPPGHVPAGRQLPHLRRQRRAVHALRHLPGRRARAVSLRRALLGCQGVGVRLGGGGAGSCVWVRGAVG